MKKVLLLILPVFAIMVLVSCQKALTDPTVTGGGTTGGGTGGADITGTWKYVNIYAVTQSTVQLSFAGTVYKTVTNTDYTTINNTGTIVITSNTFTGTGISYDVNDTAFAISYENNVVVDTIAQPVSFHLPAYNAVAPYKRVNADSIYFTSQAVGSSTTGGSGARIALSGNILKMTASAVQDTSFLSAGSLVTQHSTATEVTTLQKQ